MKTLNFTKSSIEGLPLPVGDENGRVTRVTYKDSRIEGLQLRVAGSGVKTFSLFRWVKANAKPERITIGRFPDISVERARAKAVSIIAAIANGENPAENLRSQKAEITLRTLFNRYLEDHAKPHKRTWREDQSKFAQYLTNNDDGSNLADKRLKQIDRGQLAALHAKIGRTHPVTANRVLSLVSSIFGRAIAWGLYEGQNPGIGLQQFKEKSRERFLQSDELPRFFEALTKEQNPVLRDFFATCLLTGARRRNVLSMRWEEVDLVAGQWTIPATKSKNSETQCVMLTPEVVEILSSRKMASSSSFVFPGRGKLGHLREPHKAWKRLLDIDELEQLTRLFAAKNISFQCVVEKTLPDRLVAARTFAAANALDVHGTRLADLRIHDLRRTLGSWQAITGASLPVIGKSLGHLSQTATAVYARLNHDPIRESVDRATAAILTAAGVKRTERQLP